MAKNRPEFLCGHCAARFPKWMGRCPACGVWLAVEEDLTRYGSKVVPLNWSGRDSSGAEPPKPARPKKKGGRNPKGKPPPPDSS